jgi:hypothetical protein
MTARAGSCGGSSRQAGCSRGGSGATVTDVADAEDVYVASLSGKLSVVSLARAEHNQPDPVVSIVPAGCGSVRALISRSHQVIWVTDSRADAPLAFSVPKLRTDHPHALLAKVMAGATPAGETFADGGSTIPVADANLGGPSGAVPTVAVVSAGSAPAGGPALLGYLPVGSGPRQFAVTAGGKTVLLTPGVPISLRPSPSGPCADRR